MRSLLWLLPAVTARSFVPAAAPQGPVSNYWTTWYTQNYPGMKPGGSRAMGDEHLFAAAPPANGTCPGCGWATHFFPDARSDMLLVLDDTWFVRAQSFATQWTLDPTLFPAEAGPGTPGAADWAAGVAALVARTKAAGWAGLGLWHHGILMSSAATAAATSMSPPPAAAAAAAAATAPSFPDQAFPELTAQLAQLSRAGVAHIKVDGTDFAGDVTAAAQNATGGALRIEHKRSPGAPINGHWQTDGRCTDAYIADLVDLAGRTHVLRTDDIICQMSVATCLDRMARTLAATGASGARRPAVAGAAGVIAPQDEAYMSAGLGGSLAGMRHPLPQLLGDTRINGNRNLTRRIAEVTRATRWARLAPATGSY